MTSFVELFEFLHNILILTVIELLKETNERYYFRICWTDRCLSI